MRKYSIITLLILILTLSGCGKEGTSNNFEERKDSIFYSEGNQVVIEYETDENGKMIMINIDHLLTIEQMVLLNPNIDFNYSIEGFEGDIFVEPSNRCMDYNYSLLMPVNIEVGNTRYKFVDSECKYKTVDNNNELKLGYADEYLITDTIPESRNTEISIIVYTPGELVPFTEIYDLPNTYERLGVYNIMFNFDRDGFYGDLVNYYKDMAIYEQLYIKHQENEGTLEEISGLSADVNLMDIGSLSDIVPLIENFEDIYDAEIQAIEELQAEIGIGFAVESDDVTEDETTEDE